MPGATPPGDTDQHPTHMGVAWHYGNPLTEQRHCATGALVDRSHRTVIRVSGPDAATFLHNLLSQKLDDVPDGFSGSALNLDGQGRILHYLDVTKVKDAFYLDISAVDAESLVDYLRAMVFWSQVEITVTDLGILSIIGAEVPDVGGEFSRQLPFGAWVRHDVFVPRGALVDVAKRIIEQGIEPMGLMAYTAERVRAGLPERSLDLDDKSIPHEVPALINRGERIAAVHLDKGCYRGQETVARVENLGRPPRLLTLVHLDGSAPTLPTPGTPIVMGPATGRQRTVGRIGTVIHDHEFGPIALALLKRAALTSQALMAGESAILVDPDFIPAEEQSQAGRVAINRLRGSETQQ